MTFYEDSSNHSQALFRTLMLTREELELRKLELEIRDLERHQWERPVYLSILLPIVLAGLTFSGGVMSRYFDRERVRLKGANEALKTENVALLGAQTEIRKTTEALTTAQYELSKAIESKQFKLNQLVKGIAAVEASPTPSPRPAPWDPEVVTVTGTDAERNASLRSPTAQRPTI